MLEEHNQPKKQRYMVIGESQSKSAGACDIWLWHQSVMNSG